MEIKITGNYGRKKTLINTLKRPRHTKEEGKKQVDITWGDFFKLWQNFSGLTFAEFHTGIV